MDHSRLYRFRPGAVGLTRTQLTVVTVALIIAAAGVAALLARAWLPAAALMGAAGATIGFTTLLARVNNWQPPHSK